MQRSKGMRRSGGWLVAAAAVLAACSGGGDITDSGQDATTTVNSTTPGDTLAPTTTVAPDTLPDCPVDALDSAADTVDISFWHGMSGPLNDELVRLTDAYNAAQTKVHVSLVQGSYEETSDNYLQSNRDDRPDLLQAPEYMVQSLLDTESTVPVGKCIAASGLDTTPFVQSALAAYATEGMQWSMPFNVSNPVLFYNKKVFAAAGLDPDTPPSSLDELRAMSQQIVESGAAKYGIAVESGFDSGGGWYIEQWFCKAEEFYLDNDNGRSNRATKVLYDNATGVELLTFMQDMLNDGLAVNVGDNSVTGYDNLLKMADEKEAAAMTINTSASLGPVLTVLGGGQFPQIGADDVGVGPMPGPDGKPGALIGGASLWVVDSGDDVRTAAAWNYLSWLVEAQQQSEWAAATGYVPVRSDAAGLEPYKTTLATDPRFSVALAQLEASPNGPTSAGPVVGPLRELRSVLATAVAAIFDGADVQSTLTDAAEQANGLIASYNSLNS